ncbi:MAG: hypothetical protein KKB82_01305, partial [Candidatus Omnitrophica bacterium]|nr:hypothetical protein [Candidatus Omnitrophota bacterium]MBU1924540.1 hypothetical protein [Candidatus Omnitrophota bacterium]
IFKITALALVQVFWLVNCAWCGPATGSIYLRQQQDTLSPRLYLDQELFQAGFSYLAKGLFQTDAQTIPAVELRFKAKDLREGYARLNILLRSIDKNKKERLILCVEGDVSTGKTTFVRGLQENGIAGFKGNEMEIITMDDIVNGLQEEEDFSVFEAMLEGPFILEKKLDQISADKRLVILEGAEIAHYLEKAGYAPDVIVDIKASKEARLKRHLVRYGVFAFKFFNELYLAPDLLKNMTVLEIQNNDKRSIGWASVILKMSFKTVQISLVELLKFVVPEDKLDSISGLGVLLLPLRIGAYVFGRLVDFYFGLKPSKSIIPMIKNKFTGRVKVLDVGTGRGEFVEKFQRILDKNNMPASVSGIDNNPKRLKEINENVSEIQPDVVAALKYRAEQNLEQGQAKEALIDYQRLLWLLPSEQDINFYIGFCYFELDNLLPAYVQFKAASDANPGELLYAFAVLVTESMLLTRNARDSWKKIADKKGGVDKFVFSDASMEQMCQRVQPQMEYVLSELQGDYLQVIQGSILWSQIYDALLEAHIESQTEYEDFLQRLGFSVNVDYLDSSFALPGSPRPGNDNSQSNRSDRVIYLEQRLQAKIGGEGVNVRKLNPLPKWPNSQLIQAAI